MSPGLMQILIVVVIALLLFGGRGKIAAVMGDFAKGITSFRKGLKDDEDEDEGDADAAPAPGLDAAAREDEKTGV
jgi:sec-independent protein translocase protein TatA